MSNEKSPSTVVLKDVRFSFVHVFEPTSYRNSPDKKYSVSIIIPKSDTKTIEILKAAIDYVKKEMMAKGKLPKDFKMPLRDGDVDRSDDAAYANALFINATSKTKPGLVNRIKEPIVDQDKFYSGCYGHVEVNLFGFPKNGLDGIACGLNHIMVTRLGEALSGRGSAEKAFADIEPEEDLLG